MDRCNMFLSVINRLLTIAMYTAAHVTLPHYPPSGWSRFHQNLDTKSNPTRHVSADDVVCEGEPGARRHVQCDLVVTSVGCPRSDSVTSDKEPLSSSCVWRHLSTTHLLVCQAYSLHTPTTPQEPEGRSCCACAVTSRLPPAWFVRCINSRTCWQCI